MDNLEFSTVISEGGLDSTENNLFLDQTAPGAATQLVNYEVGLYGGYRRINGFRPLNTTHPIVDDEDAEGRILGLAIYTDIDDTQMVIAARKQKSGDVYNFYYLDNAGWNPFTTGLTLNTKNAPREVIKIRHAKVVFGGVSYIIFVDGVNPPSVFDGTDWYSLASGTHNGDDMDPGGDQLIDTPSYVTVFQNHVFLAGDMDYGTIVCHSAPEKIFDWNVASGAGQLPCGFITKQIKPFRDNLYVFGNSQIKRINVDPQSLNFVLNDVATNVGTMASDSVIEINGDILFLSQDGIRTVSGTEKIGDVNLSSISNQIQYFVNYLQNSFNLDYMNSVVIKKKSQFRLFISGQSADSYGLGIIGGIRKGINGLQWEFGELRGIRTSVVENDYFNNEEYVIHGDWDGGVYRQEVGNTFNGEAITSIYETPYLTFGDPARRKNPRKLHIFMRPEGEVVFTVRTTFDWDRPYVTQVPVYSRGFEGSLTKWDDGISKWDDPGAVYDLTENIPIVEHDLEGSFKSVKFSFTTSGDYAPHTVQGFILMFSVEGKR